MGLSIQISDINHLEKFKKAINSNIPIHEYEVSGGYKVGVKYCRIVISDNVFANNLVSHGCIEHKSNILEEPQNLPKELERHFIRGFMDGNGSISVVKTNYGDIYKIRFCSTDIVLKWIMKHLIDNQIIKHEYPLYKRKEGQVVSSFDFGGNNLVKKYLDYIYQDANVWLDRKYERYLALVELLNSKLQKKKCAICGTETSFRFIRHNDQLLCAKHYSQIYKYGKIIPEKKDYCEICNNTNNRLIQVGAKYPDYHGITLCKKHYDQLCSNGYLSDKPKGDI